MKKKSTPKQEKTDYKGIGHLVIVIVFAYLIITNWDMIWIGGLVSIFLFLIILLVAAYYILPAIGVTALTGLITALGALIGVSRRK